MAAAYDFLLDSTGDLLFKDGDLAIGLSDEQHIKDTINAYPGTWKENYTDGVGILDYVGSSGKGQEVARKIKLELQGDGYTVNAPIVTISNDNFYINPNAIRD